MKAVFSLGLLIGDAGALRPDAGAHRVSVPVKADDIPRVRTRGPGPWPQDGVTGCGNIGLPQTDFLDECDEPLHPDAPDLRGFWKTEEGHIDEFIAMCGMRWADVSASVIHDHIRCDGTLEGGVEDYSGPDIVNAELGEFNNDVRCRGLCTSIRTAARFEKDEDGNKCVNLYTDIYGFGFLSQVVSRCSQPDGSMIWVHPVAGTVRYLKVPAGEEPNCMKCPDGSVSVDASQRLECNYTEREWVRCNNTLEGSSAPEPEQVGFCTPTSTSINGPLILGVAVVVLCLVCGTGFYFCR